VMSRKLGKIKHARVSFPKSMRDHTLTIEGRSTKDNKVEVEILDIDESRIVCVIRSLMDRYRGLKEYEKSRWRLLDEWIARELDTENEEIT
jgi:hypothetical protein